VRSPTGRVHAILHPVPLDEDKLAALRGWGERLRQASGEEHAAAGRAILMLIDEIDELRNELSRVHWQLRAVDPAPSQEAAENVEEPASTLNERLQRVLRREPDSGSPQSWIDSLRRQK